LEMMNFYLRGMIAGFVMVTILVSMTSVQISKAFAETKKGQKNNETMLVNQFVSVLGKLVEKSDMNGLPKLPDVQSLLEKTALENVFDQSLLTSFDLYDPGGMPLPPPPGTSMQPIEINKAIDNGDIRVDVLGTGDRSTIKLAIHNLRSDEWVLVGIPFGTQFKSSSVHVQNMGIR